jgi:hypothetical protein
MAVDKMLNILKRKHGPNQIPHRPFNRNTRSTVGS